MVQGGPVTREGIRVRIRPARGHAAERAAMRAARRLLDHLGALRAGERLLARARRLRPRRLPGPGRAWTDSRALPELPAEPFRDWWARERARPDRAQQDRGEPDRERRDREQPERGGRA
ncbi:hypothetical protein GCM10020254_69620 [Streptomyces goshikiensis]